jgi:hypothetical protein
MRASSCWSASNIHYGYVGAAASFPKGFLQWGGAYEARNDAGDVIPTDIGYKLWERYGYRLTMKELAAAIRAAVPRYLRAQREACRHGKRLDEIIRATNNR